MGPEPRSDESHDAIPEFASPSLAEELSARSVRAGQFSLANLFIATSLVGVVLGLVQSGRDGRFIAIVYGTYIAVLTIGTRMGRRRAGCLLMVVSACVAAVAWLLWELILIGRHG